jgi:hypothetical protein
MNRMIPYGSRCERLDELDAWVLEELDAWTARTRPRAVDAPGRRPPPTDQPQSPLPEDLVLPAAGADGSARADGELFDPEVQAFIERSSAWLADRQNADIILEELWQRVVASAGTDHESDATSEVVSDPVEVARPSTDRGRPGDAAQSG